MSRSIQYIGNKPKKTDTILRTEREWTRGSTCLVSDTEADAYLAHPAMFADVTDQLDEEGNPPELPPLETPRTRGARASGVEASTLRALNAKLAELEKELADTDAALDDAHEEIARLKAQIAELEAQNRELAQKIGAPDADKAKDQDEAPSTTAPEDPKDRKKAILQAFAKLEAGNAEHFDREGKPKVKAVADVLGWDISGQERDAAWQAVMEASKG